MPQSLLSPKDVADAIGASESSVRRWIDSGRLKISRTAGGHRRIQLAEALSFVREWRLPIIRPEIFGMGEVTRLKARAGDEQELFEALAAGDRALARGLVVSWFTSGRSLASIFDGPMRSALHRMGELWKRQRSGILVEHRASDICVDILHRLRTLIPPPHHRNGTGVALGAAPGDEWHVIPSLMASMILHDAGVRDIHYGANTPIDLLASAAAEHRAKIVWLSFTTQARRGMRASMEKLASQLSRSKTKLVVGGQSADAACPQDHPNVTHVGSMSELAGLIASMGPNRSRR